MVLLICLSAPAQNPSPVELEATQIGGVDARTAALLLSGQRGGDVDGAVTWIVDTAENDGRYPVSFVIEVDGRSLLPDTTSSRFAIGVFAYVIDHKGEVTDHISQGVVLESAPYAEVVSEHGIRFTGRTILDPGSYILSVVVRARGSNRFFLARRQVVVAGGLQAGGFELAPVFTDPGGGWLTIRQNGVPNGLVQDTGDAIVAAARPVLVEGTTTEFFLVSGTHEIPQIDARFVDPAGRILAEYTVDVSPRGAAPTRLVRATLPVIDLPPGPYALVLEAREQGSGAVVRRSTPVVLVSTDQPPSWIVDDDAPTATGGLQPVDDQDQDTKFRRRRVRAAYLEALREFSKGDPNAARQQLMRLERMARSHDALRTLRRIEDAVAADLAARDPRALPPIALLHHQLVRRYVARDDFVLAAFARSVAVERAVQVAGTGGDAEFAAALLVNIAGDMARTASPTLAVDYLESALSVSSSFRPALLALGAIHERGADYDLAVRFFQKLVADHPGFAEGRLRLAINLARAGRTRQAGLQFRSLLESQASTWILAVAAQEYAQMLIHDGQELKAWDLLVRLSPDLEEDQRLRVLLAYLADGAARPLESVEYILHIPPALAGTSPRARYTEWPDLGAEASALSLRNHATESMPGLANALDAIGGPA